MGDPSGSSEMHVKKESVLHVDVPSPSMTEGMCENSPWPELA